MCQALLTSAKKPEDLKFDRQSAFPLDCLPFHRVVETPEGVRVDFVYSIRVYHAELNDEGCVNVGAIVADVVSIKVNRNEAICVQFAGTYYLVVCLD